MNKITITMILAAMLSVLLLAGCTAAPAQAVAAPAPAAAPASEPATVSEPAIASEPAVAPETIQTQEAVTQAAAAPVSNELITEEAAKKAALEHAGLVEADVSFVKVELDRDALGSEYEVEFYADNMEYDYEIDALTGNVLSCDYDAEHYAPADRKDDQRTDAAEKSDTDKNNAQTNNAADATERLTKAQAQQIALDHAGFRESDVKRLSVDFEYDDGRAEYEVEFDVNRTEYSYDIDAATGKILSYDIDTD